jgi:hypothetical protein
MPSATLLYTSSDAKNHKVQASGERRIYAVATHVRVWLCESRIDDQRVTGLIQHKRTVLTGYGWDSAVAFAATYRHSRRAERHKCYNELPAQSPCSPCCRENLNAPERRQVARRFPEIQGARHYCCIIAGSRSATRIATESVSSCAPMKS